MRRACIAVAWLLTIAPCAWAEDVITPREGVIELFNGEDLEGLYHWLGDAGYDDPRDVYTVADGKLRISGDGLGYIGTRQAYRDYRLVVEFRWGERNFGERVGKARDAGIFLHAIGPDGNSVDGDGAFRASIECQIMEGATGDFLLIRGHDAEGQLISPRLTAEVAAEQDADGWYTWEPGGEPVTVRQWGRINWRDKASPWEDVFGFRGEDDIESPPGEWTRVECVAAGDRISIYVNGELVNEAYDVYPQAGSVLLQCEGSEIEFRRFELHPLKDAAGED